jgi:hypothetical protein
VKLVLIILQPEAVWTGYLQCAATETPVPHTKEGICLCHKIFS